MGLFKKIFGDSHLDHVLKYSQHPIRQLASLQENSITEHANLFSTRHNLTPAPVDDISLFKARLLGALLVPFQWGHTKGSRLGYIRLTSAAFETSVTRNDGRLIISNPYSAQSIAKKFIDEDMSNIALDHASGQLEQRVCLIYCGILYEWADNSYSRPFAADQYRETITPHIKSLIAISSQLFS